MKSRIFQTRFWDDDAVLSMGKNARYLYSYLLTCSYINICGIFQLADAKMMFETGLTKKELESGESDLSLNKKVLFKDGWVCVINARKNNNYEASELNRVACQKEINKVPEEIKEYFDTTIDTSIDTTIENKKDSLVNDNQIGGDTTIDTTIDSSQKQEIRNKKLETNNNINILSLSNDQIKELQDKFPTKSVMHEYEKAKDWCSANGKKYKDYMAFMRNWLRRSADTRTPPAIKSAPINDEALDLINKGKLAMKGGVWN